MPEHRKVKRHVRMEDEIEYMGEFSRLDIWLSHYLDQDSETFLNGAASAKAAGYKCNSIRAFASVGSDCKRKCLPRINKWIEEEGLSDSALKHKFLSLLGAKETKYFAEKGIVTDQRDVDALETQRKTLDMVCKMKGLYADKGGVYADGDGTPLYDRIEIKLVSPKVRGGLVESEKAGIES